MAEEAGLFPKAVTMREVKEGYPASFLEREYL